MIDFVLRINHSDFHVIICHTGIIYRERFNGVFTLISIYENIYGIIIRYAIVFVFQRYRRIIISCCRRQGGGREQPDAQTQSHQGCNDTSLHFHSS